jgi:hypothetical protein
MDAQALDRIVSGWLAERAVRQPAGGQPVVTRPQAHRHRDRDRIPARPARRSDHPPAPPERNPRHHQRRLAYRDRLRRHRPRLPRHPRRPAHRDRPRPLSIENKLHWIRDVTFAEDHSQIHPETDQRSWPACATSPSALTAWPAPPTSPPPADTPAATPSEPPTCSYKGQINYAEALGQRRRSTTPGADGPQRRRAGPRLYRVPPEQLLHEVRTHTRQIDSPLNGRATLALRAQ